MPRSALPSLLLFALKTGALASEEVPEYNRDIRPLLSDRCFTCHGPDAAARKGELRLDTPEGAFEKRESGPAIIPGKPAESLIWQRILSDDPDEVMPPPESHLSLSLPEREKIKRWIKGGAVYQPHWTLQRVVRPEVPKEGGNPIDSLVSTRIAKEGLSLSPEAEKATLIRRLSYDLRGLPPTPEETAAFLAYPAADAYERVVDRFLADPAYGERMAWPWLDAARYADSNGFQHDMDRTMWPWRDWVISAFNRNLSYDQFTIWQLAGDLLPDATPEQILATGFLRNHAINGEGGSIPEENRVNYAMDMSETTGTVWMGLTLNCCRCHDHKYDPLTQRDYYQFLDFFNQTPVDGSGGNPQTPPVLEISSETQKQELAAATRQAEELDRRLAEKKSSLAASQPAWEDQQRGPLQADPWEVLKPETLTGAEYDLQPDQAVLTKGPNPAKAVYTVTTRIPAGHYTALKLDALRHPSMTQGGIARSDSGNFVLTGFELRVTTPGSEARRLTFSRAEATYEQGGIYKVQQALDDDPASGWAIWDGKPISRDHAAVFHLSEALDLNAGSILEITLRHESVHPQHTLGHFRLSITGAAAPALTGKSTPLTAALAKEPAARTPEEKKLIREAYEMTDAEFVKWTSEKKALDARLKSLKATIPKVMVMAERKERRIGHILSVGSYDKPLEPVTVNTPAVLPPLAKRGELPDRLDLARWLVSRDHPLTARVTVNRFWQDLFGIGLIKTPENFGMQSELPVHQELLDWLAAEFMESGWDVKHLLRLIVTSRTYRQSSRLTAAALEKDPANRLLARGPRFRLPSWMIRDQTLAGSGALRRTIGGPPVKPYQPESLWPEATFGKVKYVRDKGDALYRRSLYTFWRRISAPPMFFDNARRDICSVSPARTNTPLHALAMLNDTTYVEAARLLASRAAKEAGADPSARLGRAFQIVLSRQPTKDESAILHDSLEQARQSFTADPAAAQAFLKNGDSPLDPALEPVEQAALASVCLSILNLDETLTKE
jgi:hypothetical protein